MERFLSKDAYSQSFSPDPHRMSRPLSTFSSSSTNSPRSSGSSGSDLIRIVTEQRAKIGKLEEDKVLLHAKNLSLRTKLADAKRKARQLEQEVAQTSDHFFRESDKREAADDRLSTLNKQNSALLCQNDALKQENDDLLDKLAELRQNFVLYHGLSACDPLQVEDIVARLQAVSLRDKIFPKQPNYTTVFTPKIPMTPIRALETSAYLGVGPTRTLAIMSPAFASMVNDTARLEVNVVINEPFVPVHTSELPITIMYLGFLYPDGTSLPYIPIRDVVIQYRQSVGKQNQIKNKERSCYVTYGHDFVYLSMPRPVYERLVRAARKAFHSRFHPDRKWNTEVDYDGDRVWVYAGMKPGAKVQGLADGKMGERSVRDALRLSGTDLEGNAMMYMRFSFPHNQDSEPSLCFRFHKLSMEREIKSSRAFSPFMLPKRVMDIRDGTEERLPRTDGGLLNIEQSFQQSSRFAFRKLLACSGGLCDNRMGRSDAEPSVL